MKTIPLIQGKEVLVDDIDYDFLAGFRWHLHRVSDLYYAVIYIQYIGKRTMIYMHQLILDRMHGYKDNKLVTDHIDRNGLNNCRHNLRWISQALNCHNTRNYGLSEYKGVTWHKMGKKWQAAIVTNRKNIYLGLFVNEIDAAKAFDRAAIEVYGNEAVTNFK